MIATLAASEHDRRKYCYYLRRSYIEARKDTKWCPAPGCEHAVSYDGGNENYDVSCLCKYAFCWNCTEEAHRPVDCETVKQWILKNSAESENTNWILANSKPCPKCLRPIEKNNGCMHMTCTKPCEFHFCWLCLGAWSDHSQKTEQSILEAKALEDLHQMQTVNMDKVKELQGIGVGDGEFEFLLNAWKQIVECRRVLRWTYAYGYYIPDHDTAKKQFFEYLQGQAESGLEKLHHCAETELLPFLDEDCPKQYSLSHAFIHFKTKLAALTEVTKIYFDNLVRALENDLSDVEFQ
ncbi:hypothetical protein M0R45_015583 [Rubus argutus]|uniref:RBR-type E3 ubiquitin transferase n=1 Tax=Rubus argutus TaxID=59490 RepID=A0AAW1XQZ6_RUBAR